MLFCILEYDLKLHYQPGSKIKLSTALSRQSLYNTKDINNTEVKGLDISIHYLEVDVTGHKLEKICIAVQCDAELWMLIKHIIEGWWDTCDQCPEPIHDYFQIWIMCCRWIGIERLQSYCHSQITKIWCLDQITFFSFMFNKNNTQSKNLSLLARIECRHHGINFQLSRVC